MTQTIISKESFESPTMPVHYDIRAVSGVTRAACGFDNRLDGDPVGWQASNNRNVVTCKDCLHKIDLLAELGGDAIQTRQEMGERRWFIEATRQAIEEDGFANAKELEARQREVVKEAMFDFQKEYEPEDRAWMKNIIKEAADEYNADADEAEIKDIKSIVKVALQEHQNSYFLSQRKLITDAVNEAINGGKLKFDDTQLRGEMHRVLNGRIQQDITLAVQRDRQNARNANSIEMTRIINNAFNTKLAEASFLVGRDFMDSPKVKNLLTNQAKIGAELNFEESKEELVELMREVIEDVLKGNPTQFVQNVYSPDNPPSASEIYRQTKGLLNSDSTPRPAPINFDRLSHQELGDWAISNDIVKEWQYDTVMTRRLLAMRQADGQLKPPYVKGEFNE